NATVSTPFRVRSAAGLRIHLYFYHTARAPSPPEEGLECRRQEPRQLGRPLDHEAPPAGAPPRGSHRGGRVDGEAPDAPQGRRALRGELPHRAVLPAPGRDLGEPGPAPPGSHSARGAASGSRAGRPARSIPRPPTGAARYARPRGNRARAATRRGRRSPRSPPSAGAGPAAGRACR